MWEGARMHDEYITAAADANDPAQAALETGATLASAPALAPVRFSGRALPLPSVAVLEQVLNALRAVLFPGYFAPLACLRGGTDELVPVLQGAASALEEQVRLAYAAAAAEQGSESEALSQQALAATSRFVRALPAIAAALATDVQAALDGDPAARLKAEVICGYPSLRALTHHRIAHALHELGVPLLPRLIGELAHSATGIDIHPGARIGSHCFIDHGTGVVIGETAVLGDRVRLYQGVTLGAKRFAVDAAGRLVKGAPRHPILEDDVVVYSGATVLGLIRIGQGAVIGGNVWVTQDVPPGKRITQSHYTQQSFQGFGDGI